MAVELRAFLFLVGCVSHQMPWIDRIASFSALVSGPTINIGEFPLGDDLHRGMVRVNGDVLRIHSYIHRYIHS